MNELPQSLFKRNLIPKVGGGGVKFRHFGKHAFPPRGNNNPVVKSVNDTYNNVASNDSELVQSAYLNTAGSAVKHENGKIVEKTRVESHFITDSCDVDEDVLFVKPNGAINNDSHRNSRVKRRRSASDWKAYSDFSYTNSPESESNEYIESIKSSPSDSATNPLKSANVETGTASQTYRTRKSTGSIKGDNKFAKWDIDDHYENSSDTKEFQLRPKRKMKKAEHELSYLTGIYETDAASDKILKLLWLNTCKEFYSQIGPKHLECLESLEAECSDETAPSEIYSSDGQLTVLEKIVKKNDTKYGVFPAPVEVLQLSKLGNVEPYDQHATVVNEIISNRGGFDEYTHRMLQMVKVKDLYIHVSNSNTDDTNTDIVPGDKGESQIDSILGTLYKNTSSKSLDEMVSTSALKGSKKAGYPLEIDWKDVIDNPPNGAYNGFDKIELGKRGRWYKDVWKEEDYLARSKQPRNSIYGNKSEQLDVYPLDDWSELLYNYNDDFDGNYQKWLTYVMKKKQSRETELFDNNNNPVIVAPPVPSAIHHPAAWGFLHNDSGDGTIDSNCIHPASVRRTEVAVNHCDAMNVDEINVVANSAWMLLQNINDTNQKGLRSLETLVQNEQNIGKIRVKKRFLGKILMAASFGQKEYHSVVMKGYSPSAEYYNYRKNIALLDYERSLSATTEKATDISVDDSDGIDEKINAYNNELNNKYNLGFGANGFCKFSYDHIHRHNYETRRTTNSLKKKSHDEYIVDESIGKNNEMEVSEKAVVVYKDMLGACLVDDVPHGSFVFKLRLGDLVEVYTTDTSSWTLGRVMKLGVDDGLLLRHTKIKILSSDELYWISVEDGRLAPPGTNIPGATSSFNDVW